MALRRVIGFQKLLCIDNGKNHFGSILVNLEGSTQVMRYDFMPENLSEFLCLVHMLENDILYYDTVKRLFNSQKEFNKPQNPVP